MRRRAITFGLLATSAPVFASNDFFNALKGGLEGLKKAQSQGGPTAASGAAPRFEDGIPASTYLRAFSSSFNSKNPRVVESPFRGLGFVVSDGIEPTFLNSDVSFFGGQVWNVVDSRSGSPRQLPDQDVAAIRTELMSRLRWELLVGPAWGEGAPKRALVLSAADCPACIKMEYELAASGRRPAMELYYLPTMLNKTSKAAGQVWCSSDPVGAWRQALLKRSLPNIQGCDREIYTGAITVALGMVAVKPDGRYISSTPTLMLDTGERGTWGSLKGRILSAA